MPTPFPESLQSARREMGSEQGYALGEGFLQAPAALEELQPCSPVSKGCNWATTSKTLPSSSDDAWKQIP